MYRQLSVHIGIKSVHTLVLVASVEKKDTAKLITRKYNGRTSEIRLYETDEFRINKGIL